MTNTEKKDFAEITAKLNAKFNAHLEAIKRVSEQTQATSENIDQLKFQSPKITYVQMEPKEIHEHRETIVNNYYFDNLGYIALGIVTIGAIASGALYLGGYFSASATTPSLTPEEVKAMASSFIDNFDLGPTNKERFTKILHEGLIIRGKNTPINPNTLNEYIYSAYEEAASYLGDNIHELQNRDFVSALKIDEMIANYVSTPINSFGSPGRRKDFLPMVKTTLAAGLVFTKIKAAFGLEMPEESNNIEANLSESSEFEQVNYCSSNYLDLLVGNSTAAEFFSSN